MCHNLVALVYSRRMASAPQKAVLVFMADRASPDGGGVYPSLATISGATSLGVSTVKRAKAGLLDAGLIRQTAWRRAKDGLIPVYALSPEAIEALPKVRVNEDLEGELPYVAPRPERAPSPERAGGVARAGWGAAQSGPPGGPERAPNHPRTIPKPSLNHIERDKRADADPPPPDKPHRKRADKAAAQEASIVAGLAGLVSEDRARAWAEHRRAKRAPMTEHAIRLMRAALETLSERGIAPDDAVDEAIARHWTGVQVRYFDRHQPGRPDRGADRQSRPGTGMAQAFAEHAAAVAAGHVAADPGGGGGEDEEPYDGIPF